MYDALLVRVRQCSANLRHNLHGSFRFDRLGTDRFAKRRALDVFHHDVTQPVGDTAAKHTNDILVIKFRQRLRFAAKTLHKRGVLRKCLR